MKGKIILSASNRKHNNKYNYYTLLLYFTVDATKSRDVYTVFIANDVKNQVLCYTICLMLLNATYFHCKMNFISSEKKTIVLATTIYRRGSVLGSRRECVSKRPPPLPSLPLFFLRFTLIFDNPSFAITPLF